MADLPDTLVFATLPSTQRCAGRHYRQAGSMSASTHMMPSSFVLTWLLFYHCSSITSTETQRHVRSGSPHQCPAFRLVAASLSEPHINGTSAARVCYMCICITRRMQHIVGRARARQRGGRIRLLPPEINWAHRMLSQSSASSLLRWSCAHWLKRVASVLSDVPLSVATYIAGGKLGFN